MVLVIGRRDSGKSVLGYRLLELLRSHGTPYVVGLPSNAVKLLPDWIGVMDRLEDVPNGSVVLVDEAYLSLHARTGMSEAGRSIGNDINLTRQKSQSLLFVAQEARQLDVNVVAQADVLAIKELSELSRGYELPQLQRLTDKARAAFQMVKGNKKKWTWVYADKANFEGMIANELPSFWKPSLSHAYAQVSSGNVSPASPRRGRKLSREEQKQQALQLHKPKTCRTDR